MSRDNKFKIGDKVKVVVKSREDLYEYLHNHGCDEKWIGETYRIIGVDGSDDEDDIPYQLKSTNQCFSGKFLVKVGYVNKIGGSINTTQDKGGK